MFSFFKRKRASDDKQPPEAGQEQLKEPQPSDAPVAPDAPASTSSPSPDSQASAGELVVASSTSTIEPGVETQATLPANVQKPAAGGDSVSGAAPAPADVPAMPEPLQPAAVPQKQAAPEEPAAPEPPAAAPAAPEPPAAAPASAAVSETPAEKKSWLSRLTRGLARTGQNISSLFVGVKVDEDLFDELETALIMADAGVEATEKLLTELRARVRKERLDDGQQVKLALRDILASHLQPLEKTFPIDRAKPLIVMIAGVNGAGKTTSIGKLAYTFQQQGRSVLLAAGDTFRAAAREQLIEWGARNNVSVIAQEGGDPAAVAFDAVNAGRAREANVVMVDTAGRLPTQLHLMEELKKIRRVISKADGDAPHEVLLVVDGNTGQNVISQIKAFDAAINLTGLIVTKLDGTAKGGALAAVAAGSQGVRPVPVYWIGVGEGMEDLQPFVAAEFARAIVAD